MSRSRPTFRPVPTLLASAILVFATASGVAAADPTPTPQPSASPSAEASPSLAPPNPSEPIASPTPTATPSSSASAAATIAPSVDLTPSPTTAASATPLPVPELSPAPTAEPTPLIEYRLSLGQQNGSSVGYPIPLYPLVRTTAPSPAEASGAGSPHAASSTLAGADCAACHATHVAQGPALAASASQASVCYRCHGGSGPAIDVASSFSGPPGQQRCRPTRTTRTPSPIRPRRCTTHRRRTSSAGWPTGTRPARIATIRTMQPPPAPRQTTTGMDRLRRDRPVAPGVAVTNGAGGSGACVCPGEPPGRPDLRVRAVPHVPLRLHRAADPELGQPLVLGARQGDRDEPGEQPPTTRSRLPAATRPHRWRRAWQERRRSRHGTCRLMRRCAARAATVTRRP